MLASHSWKIERANIMARNLVLRDLTIRLFALVSSVPVGKKLLVGILEIDT